MLRTLYSVDDLETLQSISTDYATLPAGTLQDVESDLHKKFYAWIKSDDTFKTAYQRLVRDLYDRFYPNELFILYQSFPSIRFQFVGNKSVPPHCDSDSIGNHPLGEKNFLLPITRMENTTRLFIESSPGAGDFQGIDLREGEILYFNGNTCVHSNEVNTETYARVSFDFRIVLPSDYMRYIQSRSAVYTNPRNVDRQPVKMVLGGYYQSMFQNSSPSTWFRKTAPIMQTRPNFDEAEATACASYFRNGDPFLTEFKETEALEKALAEYIGVRHCFMTPSGTSAIMTALFAAGVAPGDEVIVPDYTMVATANAVRAIGAVPVLVDVHPETYTLDIEDVKRVATPKTKVVLHVSLNNRSHRLEELVQFCKDSGVVLIEDSAQSLGCRLNGKSYGTFGDMGCFSLSSPKIITTGQGGFVVTDDDALAYQIRRIKNFGRRNAGGEDYEMFGLNFKFTDIQAVIGLAQFSKLPDRVRFMRWLYDAYASRLQGLRNITLLPAQTDEWIPWFIDVRTKHRSALQAFLSQHDVQTRVTYPALHTIPPNSGEGFPNTQTISTEGLFLPSHTKLSELDVDYVCTLLRVFDAHCG